jgi:Notch-like protein
MMKSVLAVNALKPVMRGVFTVLLIYLLSSTTSRAVAFELCLDEADQQNLFARYDDGISNITYNGTDNAFQWLNDSGPVLSTFGLAGGVKIFEDIDGDGFMDLLISTTHWFGFYSIVVNKGTSEPDVFQKSYELEGVAIPSTLGGSFSTYALLPDMNGDGYMELAICNTTSNEIQVYHLGYNAVDDEVFVAETVAYKLPHEDPYFPSTLAVMEDLNGDGMPELVVAALDPDFYLRYMTEVNCTMYIVSMGSTTLQVLYNYTVDPTVRGGMDVAYMGKSPDNSTVNVAFPSQPYATEMGAANYSRYAKNGIMLLTVDITTFETVSVTVIADEQFNMTCGGWPAVSALPNTGLHECDSFCGLVENAGDLTGNGVNDLVIGCPGAGYWYGAAVLVYLDASNNMIGYDIISAAAHLERTTAIGNLRDDLFVDIDPAINGVAAMGGASNVVYTEGKPVLWLSFPGGHSGEFMHSGQVIKVPLHNCDCTGTGYNGTYCDVDVNDCTSSPCANGICTDDRSVPNAFNCTCDSGYTGALCHQDIDDCASSPCFNGTCSDDGSVPHAFNCTCDSGFNGTLCNQDMDDCKSNPCVHGACLDDGSEPNAFQCVCESMYTGVLCDEALSMCVSSPCENNGTCTDLPSFALNCTCTEGYEGVYCESEVPSCSATLCENNATCIESNSDTGFECLCLSGTNGTLCEEDVDDCNPNPCYSSGTSGCFDLGISLYECKCEAGFTGDFCQISELNSHIVTVTLAAVEDVGEFSAGLEEDLQVEYPDVKLTVEFLYNTETIDGDVEATFVIAFWTEGVDGSFPDAGTLQDVLYDSGYTGVQVDNEEASHSSSPSAYSLSAMTPFWLAISAVIIN